MKKGLEQTFLQKEYSNDQKTPEKKPKMLSHYKM